MDEDLDQESMGKMSSRSHQKVSLPCPWYIQNPPDGPYQEEANPDVTKIPGD